jgi:hypothetical protein
VPHDHRAPSAQASPRETTLRRRLQVLVALALAPAAIGVASCASRGPSPSPVATSVRLATVTRLPAIGTAVLAGTPDTLAASLARSLITSAPVVVIAPPGRPALLATAARLAVQARAPLLLTAMMRASAIGSTASQSPPKTSVPALLSPVARADIAALAPRYALAVGVPAAELAAELPHVRVVTDPARLPLVTRPRPQPLVTLLVHAHGGAVVTAAVTTAKATGVHLVRVTGFDPRADPKAIAALAAVRSRRIVAVGAGFGPARVLAARVDVAETGVQLPGGGQVLFPGHLLVALYGHPTTPSLGVLGRQDLPASIARARRMAAPYRKLCHVPVVPTFEIIATVAQGSPGYDGMYSYETPVSVLLPWIRQATAAHMYVVLDLQPGRANFLSQAKHYASLLRLPNVGLALDPEWKLQPRQLPLHQIGGVGIAEVNSVVNWLAQLTARYRLPQKLLVLHQFRLSMILGEQDLDTHHDDLAIVIHMDGQGTQAEKWQTWRSVLGAAPRGVFFGWKNFLVKDHPMADPQQTMDRTPRPVMVSYQ